MYNCDQYRLLKTVNGLKEVKKMEIFYSKFNDSASEAEYSKLKAYKRKHPVNSLVNDESNLNFNDERNDVTVPKRSTFRQTIDQAELASKTLTFNKARIVKQLIKKVTWHRKLRLLIRWLPN